MTAVNQDFSLYSGASLNIDVTVKDALGVVINFSLTPYTARWVLYTAGEVLITKTSDPGGGITFPAPTEGVMRITLAVVDTVDLVSGIYGHEARLTDLSSNSVPVMVGLVTVEESKSD